ncbi:unnamed protein product [Rotaria sp. Silwood1]|nr:unnamed protein product [Rotaria sp. Silwood1]CAF0841469.1 unnamed protein product [Rotaria sp. Silwood1]CAF3370355.1 unnamed protein product [Rotaria sp. Silwood1]CAF3404983.1 unnamed protein product [Rotaria sp. Silwood1]CAF4819730.1 unnamed protein product [Rotaria sp. Silwood1]
MMILVIFLLFWTFHSFKVCIHGAETDLSMLTVDQAIVWLKAVSEINNISQEPHIEIIHLDHEIEIPLYDDRNNITHRNRHLFKQNINKRVDNYLYEDQLNPNIPSNIYDKCHGTLLSKQTVENIAGIYVYAGNPTSYGLGIIIIETIHSFQWFNHTEFYSFDNQSNLKNGTKLVLGFETIIYYNSNSDLILYNKKINDIIQQANISIKYDNNNNLEKFLLMENLSCRRHERIVYDDLRSLVFACTIQVTFKCPLQIGSTCWLENKKISNIYLNINSFEFISDRTITVRIDV